MKDAKRSLKVKKIKMLSPLVLTKLVDNDLDSLYDIQRDLLLGDFIVSSFSTQEIDEIKSLLENMPKVYVFDDDFIKFIEIGDQLDDTQKTVYKLHCKGFSCREIGEFCSLSPFSVRPLLDSVEIAFRYRLKLSRWVYTSLENAEINDIYSVIDAFCSARIFDVEKIGAVGLRELASAVDKQEGTSFFKALNGNEEKLLSLAKRGKKIVLNKNGFFEVKNS